LPFHTIDIASGTIAGYAGAAFAGLLSAPRDTRLAIDTMKAVLLVGGIAKASHRVKATH